MDLLAAGTMPDFPLFAYEDPFDPASPQSLLVALFPETRSVRTVSFPLSASAADVAAAAVADAAAADASAAAADASDAGSDTASADASTASSASAAAAAAAAASASASASASAAASAAAPTATHLDGPTAEFVRAECARKGWAAPLPAGETPASHFLKTRLRAQDDYTGDLSLPEDAEQADAVWVGGCVRVLKLWRTLEETNARSAPAAHSPPSLREFEQRDDTATTARFFAALADVRPPAWTLRQRLEFLLVPYCRYTERFDLLAALVAALPLSETAAAAAVPELADSVLARCLAAPLADWREVRRIAETVAGHASPATATTTSSSSSSSTSSSSTSAAAGGASAGETAALLVSLVPAAQAGKLRAAQHFAQLVDWARAAPETQRDVLRRALLQTQPISREDLATLRSTVFARMDERAFQEESVRASLARSRFMLLRSMPLEAHHGVLRDEIRRLVRQFGSDGSDGSDGSGSGSGTRSDDEAFRRILTALELVGDDDAEIAALRKQFSHLSRLAATFPSLTPRFALAHPGVREQVARVLEQEPTAYLRYTDLVTVVGRGDRSLAPEIAEQCVESALVHDDFAAACEYFERGFVSDASPNAWLAYYQTGKYMSPQWNLPKPEPVLRRQHRLMARSLNLCPPADLVAVLRAWNRLEAELVEAAVDAEPTAAAQTAVSNDDLGAGAGAGAGAAAEGTAGTAGTAGSAAAHRPRSSHGGSAPLEQKPRDPRDQLSNLLVSGLGWAIGANR